MESGERAVYAFNCNNLSLGRVSIIVCLKENLALASEVSSVLSTHPIIFKNIRWEKGGRANFITLQLERFELS